MADWTWFSGWRCTPRNRPVSFLVPGIRTPPIGPSAPAPFTDSVFVWNVMIQSGKFTSNSTSTFARSHPWEEESKWQSVKNSVRIFRVRRVVWHVMFYDRETRVTDGNWIRLFFGYHRWFLIFLSIFCSSTDELIIHILCSIFV